MPRGTVDWSKNNTAMGADTFVNLTEKPTRYIFEGIGQVKDSKYGPQTPIYVLSEKDRLPLTISAFTQLYKEFKDAGLERWDIFEGSVVITLVKDEFGAPVYTKTGNEKKNYVYTIKKVGKAEVEVDMDDVVDGLPF